MSRTGSPIRPSDRPEQRTFEEVGAAEDQILDLRRGPTFVLRQTGTQDLPRVVPLVERCVDVEPLVALQPDQFGVEQPRQDLGQLGLAAAGVAFDEQRLAHLPREVQRRRD